MGALTILPLIVVTCLLMLVANWLFERIAAGELFLLPWPFDRPADNLELLDSQLMVTVWRLPSQLTLLVLVGLSFLAWAKLRNGPQKRTPFSTLERWLVICLAGATAADLATTLWFCHTQSGALELHPGIRLFIYAFGRTTGPGLAKLLQLSGILAMGLLFPRFRIVLFSLASCLQFSAAVYNVLQLT